MEVQQEITSEQHYGIYEKNIKEIKLIFNISTVSKLNTISGVIFVETEVNGICISIAK